MTVNHRETPTGTISGTTRGLATAEFSGERCEQVYVKETGDKGRPIRLEFWEGYSVPNHAILTREQAVELAFLLLRWDASAMSALSNMLRTDLGLEPGVGTSTQVVDDHLHLIKATFKKWLSEVGLPDYFSLDKEGNGFNSMESIRELLVTLVDEPGSEKC